MSTRAASAGAYTALGGVERAHGIPQRGSGEDSSAGAYIFIMADIILSVIIASARSIIEQPKDDVEPERLARE